MEGRECGVVVITPDSIRDGLEDAILADLLDAVSANVLWTKLWRPTPVEILTIYPNLPKRISFTSVMQTMTLGECRVVLLRGDDLYRKLKETKGSIAFSDDDGVKVTGLRYKYRSWNQEELLALGAFSQAALDKIFEFRLHAADSLADSALVCSLCMSEKEIQELAEIAPCLYAEVLKLRRS